jgi:hypothetical protein
LNGKTSIPLLTTKTLHTKQIISNQQSLIFLQGTLELKKKKKKTKGLAYAKV